MKWKSRHFWISMIIFVVGTVYKFLGKIDDSTWIVTCGLGLGFKLLDIWSVKRGGGGGEENV